MHLVIIFLSIFYDVHQLTLNCLNVRQTLPGDSVRGSSAKPTKTTAVIDSIIKAAFHWRILFSSRKAKHHSLLWMHAVVIQAAEAFTKGLKVIWSQDETISHGITMNAEWPDFPLPFHTFNHHWELEVFKIEINIFSLPIFLMILLSKADVHILVNHRVQLLTYRDEIHTGTKAVSAQPSLDYQKRQGDFGSVWHESGTGQADSSDHIMRLIAEEGSGKRAKARASLIIQMHYGMEKPVWKRKGGYIPYQTQGRQVHPSYFPETEVREKWCCLISKHESLDKCGSLTYTNAWKHKRRKDHQSPLKYAIGDQTIFWSLILFDFFMQFIRKTKYCYWN